MARQVYPIDVNEDKWALLVPLILPGKLHGQTRFEFLIGEAL